MALRGTLTHRKIRTLARLLEISPCFALGIVESLWHVTAEQAPAGNIGRMADEDLAMEMFYDADAKKLVLALIGAKLLDTHPTHRLIVHDWHLHADDATDNKIARQKERYASGEVPRMKRLSKNERDHLIAQYATPCAQNPTESHEEPLPVPEPEPVPEPVPEKDISEAKASSPPEVRPQEFANAWNRLRGPLPKVMEFTESRKRKVATRQSQGISLESFEKAVAKCAQIPFLSGDNDRGWKANFDWLVENDTNMLSVMEGKYDKEQGNGTSKDNSGSNGTRGAAVGRVERGQSAFRQAAIASVEAAGGFDAGPDDGSLPFAGASPGHSEDVPARSGDAGGGVRDSQSGNSVGVVSHAPEILPPSQRNPGGLGSHGSQRAH